MKGILMKPEGIRATAEGRKTNTRRVEAGLKGINQDPDAWVFLSVNKDSEFIFGKIGTSEIKLIKPRYQVGETVYIKEAWCESYYGEPICYKLDGKESPGPKGFWRSPMFLKAINARYFILIKDVRAERLQEITIVDIRAEGIGQEWLDAKGLFRGIWNSINKDYPWEANPWVFRYEFELKEMPNG